jgi:hypothetical protein
MKHHHSTASTVCDKAMGPIVEGGAVATSDYIRIGDGASTRKRSAWRNPLRAAENICWPCGGKDMVGDNRCLNAVKPERCLRPPGKRVELR